MGAGKSTVGSPLAAWLGRPFVDLDALVVQREGAGVPELFARGRFREAEAEALDAVLGGPPVVLATGGGAPCQPGAMERLLDAGWVCYLEVPVGELKRRVGAGEGRPLWGPDAEALLREREPTYRRAHAIVDGTGADVVSRVMEAWRAR